MFFAKKKVVCHGLTIYIELSECDQVRPLFSQPGVNSEQRLHYMASRKV